MSDAWSSVIIAICAAIPSTLGSIATLLYVMKMKNENRESNKSVEKAVEEVKKEVDGKHTLLIQAVKDIATAVVNKENNLPRTGRKTDP